MCLQPTQAHYLSFIIQWKHDFFSPVSLILFLPGNNFSFSSTPLATNERVLPYNGEIALLEQNVNKIKIRRTLAQLPAMPYFPPSLTTSSQPLGFGEQSRHAWATAWWWLPLLPGRPSSSTVFPVLQLKTSQEHPVRQQLKWSSAEAVLTQLSVRRYMLCRKEEQFWKLPLS